jgi:hypothetical protein
MGITAISGPQICYGTVLSSSGAPGEYNEHRGPSLADLGEGLLDPRPQYAYRPGTDAGLQPGAKVFAWAGLFGGPVLDQAPSIANTSGLAPAQTSTGAAGTFLTLATTAQNTFQNSITPTTIFPATIGTAVSVLAIDGVQKGTPFGTTGFVNLWDPTNAIARAPTLTAPTTADTTGSYLVTGFDLYGFQLTWKASGSGTAATQTCPKAMKYIRNIQILTPGTSNVAFGISDTYGFPLRLDHPAYLSLWLGQSSDSTLVTVAVGNHTFAYTGVTTSTTPDVRGTYASTTATTGGTIFGTSLTGTSSTPFRIVMIQSPSVQNLATIATSQIYGSSGVLLSSAATGYGGVSPSGVLNFAGIVGVPQA